MSGMISSTTITKLVREIGVEIAWYQWADLGAGASRRSVNRHRPTIIDPEALLLLSLAMRDSERRLGDFIAWWAARGSTLLSVQRVKTLVTAFPVSVSDGLREFAWLATDAGDRRWDRHAAESRPDWGDRRLKGAGRPRLHLPSALLLRLRAGFGVNAKSDAIAYMLGRGHEASTIQDIAAAVAYSKVAVRNALQDMLQARLVTEVPGHPVRYLLDRTSWTRLLDVTTEEDLPVWAHWSGICAFVARANELFVADGTDGDKGYVLSSRARDLATDFGDIFARNRIEFPYGSDVRGAAYLEVFHGGLTALKRWAFPGA